MIRGLDLTHSKRDQIKGNFEPVAFDDELMYKFGAIEKRLLKKGEPDFTGGMKTTPKVTEGFEDVLDGKLLGQGLYDNHSGSARQLVFGLSLSSNPEIARIIDKSNPDTSRDIVQKLRSKRVLSGLKIIDLGCGSGSFALSAKSLGAEVYTADVDELHKDRKARLDGHVRINFNDKDAGSRLKAETGGEFDLVTENIIGAGRTRTLLIPRDEFRSTISRIADVLLKRGGYLYGDEFGITTSDGPFRKI